MFEYLLRLLFLLPMVGALVWGSLWLWKRFNIGFPQRSVDEREVRIVEFVTLGAGNRLAVIEFGGRKHLLGLTRNQIELVASDQRESTDDL